MNLRKRLEWLVMALTAGLLMLLDWLHLGVLHYNLFLLIMLGLCTGLVLCFRALNPLHRRSGEEQGEK